MPLDELEGRNTAASHRSECLSFSLCSTCSPSVWSTFLRLCSPLIFRCFGALLTPSGSHRALVRSVADGGMNIMRIWGGGVYQLDAFYDAADEFGVLLYRANTRLNRSALGSCEAVPVDADCGITWTFVEE